MSTRVDLRYDYQVGGSLRLDSPTYIYREADRALLETLQAGEYCYVFNSRQMGKSSLRVRTQQRLIEAGRRCASIDMTSIGSEDVTPSQWYKGLVVDLLSKFGLHGKVSFKEWWTSHDGLSMVHRLRLFIEEILLPAYPDTDLVIFVDEIDSALALNFSIDDFFALVRYCYDQQAENPMYRRLSWALFGVATPSDLIRDRARTPFNVGKAIELKGFQFDNAKVLARGLSGYGYDEIAIVQEILTWTNGQPFLTQKLCRLVEQLLKGRLRLGTASDALSPPPHPAALVEQLVYAQIIEHWESQDNPEHLRTIRDRILSNEKVAPRLLGIYETILCADTPQCMQADLPESAADARRLLAYDDSPEHMELLLSGLINNEQGVLRVKNPIYKTIFSIGWVQQQLGDLRPYARQLAAWVKSNGTDESRLLRGKALKDAQIWSMERSVSEVDHDFLMASELLDRRIAQQILKVAKLKETEKRLAIEKKAQKRLRSLIFTLSGALIVAVTLGLYARNQYEDARRTEFDAILSTSEAKYSSHQRLDALVQALRAEQKSHPLGTLLASKTQDRAALALREAAVSVVEKNRLTFEKSNVWDVDISRDGRKLATSLSDGKVKLWHRDGSPIATLKGHEARVRTVNILPRTLKIDEQIVSGSDRGHVILHSIEGEILRKITAHSGTINDIATSNDGSFFLSAGTGPIKRWSRSGALLNSFEGHSKEVLAVAVSPDGRTVASSSEDGTVKIWQVNGRLIRTLTSHRSPVLDLAFSPNGKRLATSSRDQTIQYWQVDNQFLDKSGDQLKLDLYKGRRTGLFDSAPSAEENVPGTASEIAPVEAPEQAVSAQTGESSSPAESAEGSTADGDKPPAVEPTHTLTGHKADVISIDFSPNGQKLVSASRDHTIRLWNLDGEQVSVIEGHEGRVNAIEFSYDGRALISAAADKTVRLWDLTNPLLTRYTGPSAGIIGVDIRPDGKMVAAASDDYGLYLWNRRSGKLSRRIEHPGAVLSASFGPDGLNVLTGSWDGNARIWTLQGELLTTIYHGQPVWDAEFSPDGKTLVTGSVDGRVRLWNLDGTQRQSFARHDSEVRSASFSADGEYIVSASLDDTVRLWTVDGELLHEFQGQGQGYIDANFSPDGRFIVAGGFNNTAEIWNVETKALKAVLVEHDAEVRSASFSEDSKQVVTASGDGTVKLWTLEGERIATLSEGDSPIWQALFAEGDRTVISAGEDKRTLLWNLDEMLDEAGLVEISCRWASDYLNNSADPEDRTICEDFR